MAKQDLQNSIKFLRERIKEGYDEFHQGEYSEFNFRFIDDYLSSSENSDLEKAFFLILHQFPGDSKDYIVRPKEMVLLPDVYDMGSPGIEYEIDFALYGGSIDNPVKVAIECDGLRSHGQKHVKKDRRKDVNLQAAGWIVMRFGSREIHQELDKFSTDENYICYFLMSIENTISQKLKLIDNHTYLQFKDRLTGYKMGIVTCPKCNNSQTDILNHVNMKCRHCKTKFKREIRSDEKIAYQHNRLIFFQE